MVYTAMQEGIETVFVPDEDAAEAALIEGVTIIPVRSIGQLVEHLYQLNPINPYRNDLESESAEPKLADGLVDFADIRGQEHVKRALEVAAAGNHNILMSGPPGAGKSLQARALAGILPSLVTQEALEGDAGSIRLSTCSRKKNRSLDSDRSAPPTTPSRKSVW